ncbi:hypothetical protein [Microbacterium sp. P04]|uniref:hypothetical protein n=1 Tax=Microbacterium sp. P04 TaxID=3366947 RepID=UPI003746C85F
MVASLLLVMLVGVALPACSSGGKIGQLLRPGLSSADGTFSSYVDDVGRLARQSEVTVPAELDDAMRAAKAEAAAGARLTDEEAALLARGEEWVQTFHRLDEFLAFAIDWQLALPDDAVRLMNASLLPDHTLAFRERLYLWEQQALKALMCTSARDGLDAAAEAQAQNASPSYEVTLDSVEDIEQYVRSGLSLEFTGVDAAVDLVELADETFGLHNDYVDGIVAVAESPSGAMAAANIVYFRACVAR